MKLMLKLTAMAFVLPAAAALAEPPATSPATGAYERNAATTAGRAMLGRSYRASEIMGLTVENAAGENVGEINDLVVDPISGRPRYVAISVGGFLGMGDKLFAVPYEAVTFRHGDAGVNPAVYDATPPANTTGEARTVNADASLNDVVAILDVTPNHFKKEQGFDADHWPNFADATWRTTNEDAFRQVRRTPRQQEGSTSEAAGGAVRASELIGLNVVNDANDTVGEINDLVLDDQSGVVRYAALSIGGFLGMGDKLFAVPLRSFQVTTDEDGDLTARLPVTKESFDGIEGFDQDHWPNTADPNWRQDNDRRYESWSRASTEPSKL